LTLSSLFAALWRRQFYSGPTRLGETNGDRLLWRAGAVFAFPNMFHFFAHKLTRLSAGRFAFTLVFACSFDCFFFWHITNCFASSDGFGRRKIAYDLCAAFYSLITPNFALTRVAGDASR